MNAKVPNLPSNIIQAPWSLLTELGRQQLALAARQHSERGPVLAAAFRCGHADAIRNDGQHEPPA